MVIKQYQFGKVVIRICAPKAMKEDARFEAFVVNSQLKPDFVYEIYEAKKHICSEENKSITTVREGDLIKAYMDISLLPEITVANFFSAVQTAVILPEKREFILHCSHVYIAGKSLLFCAPSETGKSTQARFWEQNRSACIVNEDRTIITKGNNTFFANGCWAMGRGTICKNVTAPIWAIILLGQGSENRVYPVKAHEALKRILPQCSFDERSSTSCESIIHMVSDLITHVPVLGYDCIKDSSAVTDLEKYL